MNKKNVRQLSLTASKLATLVLLLFFVIVSWLTYRSSPGDDLSSGYIACRLIASGQKTEIYSHHPELFHVVNNDAWRQVALDVGFQGFLHPYVQVPLWAAVLKPLCMSLDFFAFNSIFVFLAALATAILVYLAVASVSRRPEIFFLSLLLTGWLWFSAPYQYSLFLTQTHAIFIACAVIALFLEKYDRHVLAGLFLAIAAIVKITPIFLVIYWIVGGKLRAAAWCAIWVTLLVTASMALTGIHLHIEFIGELKRISNVLLVAFNNQSLASAVLGSQHPHLLGSWKILELPLMVKLVSTSLTVLLVAGCGVLEKRHAPFNFQICILLVSITSFPAIAWTHYFIILVFPMAALLIESMDRKSWILAGVALTVGVLCIYPIAIDPIKGLLSIFGLTRGVFLASMLALVACLLIATLNIKKSKQ